MPFDEEMLKQALYRESERELAEIPSQEELKGTMEISLKFYKKMEKLIRRHKIMALGRTIGRNAAMLLIVLLSTLVLLCAINEDVRATCLQWIRTMISGGMTQYQPVSTDGEGEKAAGFMLEYIPDGYVMKTEDMDEDSGYVIYVKGDAILGFNYVMIDGTSALVDNEDSFLSHWTLADGTPCDLYAADFVGDQKKLLWKRGAYICELYIMNLDEDEILQIAENVRMMPLLEK